MQYQWTLLISGNVVAEWVSPPFVDDLRPYLVELLSGVLSQEERDQFLQDVVEMSEMDQSDPYTWLRVEGQIVSLVKQTLGA